MSVKQSMPTREERLVAQLRANLRRRKEQARALQQNDALLPPEPEDTGLPKPDGRR